MLRGTGGGGTGPRGGDPIVQHAAAARRVLVFPFACVLVEQGDVCFCRSNDNCPNEKTSTPAGEKPLGSAASQQQKRSEEGDCQNCLPCPLPPVPCVPPAPRHHKHTQATLTNRVPDCPCRLQLRAREEGDSRRWWRQSKTLLSARGTGSTEGFFSPGADSELEHGATDKREGGACGHSFPSYHRDNRPSAKAMHHLLEHAGG